MTFTTMIELTYSEIKTEYIDEEELYDALITTWENHGNSKNTAYKLKDCWQEYETDILDNLYSIWVIDGEIENTNLVDIFTSKFWEEFTNYLKAND